MRFVSVISSLCVTLIVFSANVQAQTTPPQSAATIARATQVSPAADQTARKMLRGINAAPQTIAGFYGSPISTNLGAISGIVMDDDGTIYTIDETRGRLYALPDRGQDGRLDGRRLLMDGFQQPSGMAYIKGTLYISDIKAVWAVDIKTRTRTHITSLGNTDSDPTPRPLAVLDSQIILGLSKTTAQGASAHIVRIDPKTGRAETIDRRADGPVSTVMVQPSGQIWAAIGTQLIPLGVKNIAFPILDGAPITGAMFGMDDAQPPNWPETLRGAIYLSLGQTVDGSAGSYSVVSLSSAFGSPAKNMKIIVDGFYNARTNQTWGRPTALMMSRHGLIIADHFGTLWRVSIDDRPVIVPKEKTAPPTLTIPKQKPSQKRGTTTPMIGSQMGDRASQIKSATSLTVGSTLLEKHNIEKAEKEKAEKDAEAAEK